MRKLKRVLLLLMPLVLFYSQQAMAWGWHDRLHSTIMTCFPWLYDFLIALHVYFGWAPPPPG